MKRLIGINQLIFAIRIITINNYIGMILLERRALSVSDNISQSLADENVTRVVIFS